MSATGHITSIEIHLDRALQRLRVARRENRLNDSIYWAKSVEYWESSLTYWNTVKDREDQRSSLDLSNVIKERER